jgi:hypothetical protein
MVSDPTVLARALDHAVLIHVCRDRTLSYRARNEPIFNGVALPVYSVPDKTEAEMLVRTVGSVQYEEHPRMPGQPWRKINLDSKPFEPYLELTDLEEVTAKLDRVYAAILARRQAA